MNDDFDPRAELDRLKALPPDQRPGEVEELIEKLERQLEEKSPRPSSNP